MYDINLSALETEIKAFLSACLNLEIDEDSSGFYEATCNNKLVIYQVELNKPAPETLDYSDICSVIAIDAFIYDDLGGDLGLMHYFEMDCLSIEHYQVMIRLEYSRTN